MEKEPPVSVIIATRNRPAILEQCLQHLFVQDYRPVEVIVVDNSTSEETQTVVAMFSPEVRYVRDAYANLAHLRNVGIQHARGEIMVFIDDDCFVHEGWLEHLVSNYADPTVGAVTGRMITTFEPEHSSPVIGRMTKWGKMVGGSFNCNLEMSFEVDYAIGCNMSFRRQVLAEVGLFDPIFNIAYEEQDLSFRIRQSGYRVIFDGRAVVTHLVAPRDIKVVQRGEVRHPRSRFYHCRSIVYLCLRYFGLSTEFLRFRVWGDIRYACALALRNPTLKTLSYVGATVLGIAWGTALAIKTRITDRGRGAKLQPWPGPVSN